MAKAIMKRMTVLRAARDLSLVPVTPPERRHQLTEDRDEQFVKFAKDKGLANLKGHRLVGGMRASIYNAMPLAGVKALVECMKEFEAHV